MKFPISMRILFVFAAIFLFSAQPSFAKMGSDLPVQQQEVKTKKLSLKERIAQRYLKKKLERQLKKDRTQNNANSSNVIRWILIIAGILIAIALLGTIGGLVGQILSIIIFAIVLVFILQLLGVI